MRRRRDPLAGLPLCRVTEHGVPFETGVPVLFKFVHNSEEFENFGSRYGQDVEPAGMYLLHNPRPRGLPKKWVAGVKKFQNPLVMAATTDGDMYGPNGWKARLAKAHSAAGAEHCRAS